MIQGELFRVEVEALFRWVTKFTNKKPHLQKCVQKGGELIASMAYAMITEKKKKEAIIKANIETKMLYKIQRNKEEKLHQEGVIAHRYKRLRKKILLNLSLEDISIGAFLVPIPNWEIEEKLVSL